MYYSKKIGIKYYVKFVKNSIIQISSVWFFTTKTFKLFVVLLIYFFKYYIDSSFTSVNILIFLFK